MLHVRLRRGQVRLAGLALATTWMLVLAASTVLAQAEHTDAQAQQLTQSGRHLEAAARYEHLAHPGFFTWDAGFGLLAAREYLAAGERDEATRIADKVRGRVRTDEERVLLAMVDAGLALERNDAPAALGVLARVPADVPTALAPDVLQLRGRAQLASGETLAGIRSFELRGPMLQASQARAANDRELFDLLLLHPPASTLPPAGASERERGWLELPVLVAALGTHGAAPPDPAVARRLQDWLAQHPGHPGAAFLPRGAAPSMVAGAGVGFPIALLLPLSGRTQQAASAVRDGFAAAWFVSGSAEIRPRIEVYDTTTGAAAAYQRALADGARIVVGPLLKEEVTAIVASQPSGLPVPTLALNAAFAPGATTPSFLYQYTLDPEQEARAVAHRIADDGLARGVALFPQSAWGTRLHDAFVDELQRIGTVTLMSTQYYEPGAKDFSEPLRAALGRFGGAGDRASDHRAKTAPPARDVTAEQAAGPQFAFVAATPATARAIRPQLRFQMTYDLAVYATSDAWEPSVRAAADMDGMVFPEMPWVLSGGQGAPELWSALQQEWSAHARGHLRLYAFGYDAFRLAQQLATGSTFVAFEGLTGNLELSRDASRVQRGLHFARVDGGRLQPAGAIAVTPATNATSAPPSQ